MAALTGKIAWLTGAGSGIGRAGAQALAEAGATVIISGRTPEGVQESVALITQAGGKAEAAVLDVADKQSRRSAPTSSRGMAASTFSSTAPGSTSRRGSGKT
jgi:NADP-dependent 3-hydroxy acid dehydrogenase YdfG